MEEYAGVVSQIPIAGLIDPIVIRMSSETAVVGDECAYFDTENWVWSESGTQLMTEEQLLQVLGADADLQGSWCAVSHTSIFGIIQTVPFDLAYQSAENTLGSGFIIAVAIVLAVGGCLCLLCLLYCSRLHAPSKGRAALMMSKTRGREVNFQCSEVILDDVQGTEGTRKVMVQWDVKPEKFMKDLDKFRGVRHITTDTSVRPRVVRSMSRLSSRSGSRPERSASNWLSDEGDDDPWYFDLDAIAASVSKAAEEEVTGEEEIIDIDAGISFVERSPGCEAYEVGEYIMYCSVSHEQMIFGAITSCSSGLSEPCSDFLEAGPLPCYDCRMGKARQRRSEVPMQMLRPALIPGTAVMARVEEKWIPAHVLGVNPSSGTCQVDLDDDSELKVSYEVYQLPFRDLRRRFWRGQPCRLYRGIVHGWVNCLVGKDLMEELPSLESEKLGGTTCMASVFVDDQEEPIDVPTYLLKMDHNFTTEASL